ncbi:E3 ubiquitin-protein ligase RNF216-like [Halyomorpha halys]|uniref:E3 ubiquitin-protein ligase RNF216-like n=1 Tax=Halyomorpha halys TaxID=286706 RepID=UPI0006D527D7|nr:E3 ubiquitin-protein ligase RNF216-like [Halyomorpha halys]
MTAALIRNCYHCGSKFVREDGCNKMICLCGAMMCYFCRKSISGYSHFSDKEEEIMAGKCPLWTENKKLHTEAVNLEAEKAIEEIKRKNPKCDTEMYKKLKK